MRGYYARRFGTLCNIQGGRKAKSKKEIRVQKVNARQSQRTSKRNTNSQRDYSRMQHRNVGWCTRGYGLLLETFYFFEKWEEILLR